MNVKSATFVTINVTDFWKTIRPHRNYCIINVDIPQDESYRLPQILRRVLQLSAFNSKTNRMGKIIRVSDTKIRFYSRDRLVYNAHLDS